MATLPKGARWQAPPPRGNHAGKGKLQRAVAAMREHPGKWMFVKKYDNEHAAGEARRKLKMMGCDATTRRQWIGNRLTVDLYGMWPE